MSNNKKHDSEGLRRHFSPEDKIKIFRLHLLEKIPGSEVCEKHPITPTQLYQRQKIFFESGASAFAKSSSPRAATLAEQRAQALEQKLQRKDEVIAEIVADYMV